MHEMHFIVLWLTWFSLIIWRSNGLRSNTQKSVDAGLFRITNAAKHQERKNIGLLTPISDLMKIFHCDDCDEPYTNFTVTYRLTLEGTRQGLDDPVSKSKFESVVKQILNQDSAKTGVFFFSFDVVESDDGGKQGPTYRVSALGKGRCKGKNCASPPDFDIPKIRYTDERTTNTNSNSNNGDRSLSSSHRSSSYLDDLKRASVELPVLDYVIQPKENKVNRNVQYEVSYLQRTRSPWESLDALALKPSDGSLLETPTTECPIDDLWPPSVDDDNDWPFDDDNSEYGECERQRRSIASIFSQLEITDYDKDDHECSWPGVVCDDSNLIIELRVENNNATEKTFPRKCTQLHHLTALYLINNGLIGTLPTALGRLKKLRVVSLENNMLTGNIPSELGLLTSMSELRLNRNGFFGGMPSQLGNAIGLEILDISRNQNFGGTIASEIGNLINLRSLILYESGVNGSLPNTFGLLMALENALLRDNNFDGTIDVFCRLQALRVLDLADNHFSKEIPNDFENTLELTVLNLYNNEFEGKIPATLGNLPLLTDIILAKNDFKEFIPSIIGSLTNLKVFDVADNDLTSTIPSELGKLKKLKTLNLHGNNFKESIPSELGTLSELAQMVLSGNKLTGAVPSELGQNSNIEFIDIGHNLLSETIPTTFNDLTTLKTFYIWGNYLTGNVGFLCDIENFEYDVGVLDPLSCDLQKGILTKFYRGLKQVYEQNDSECNWPGVDCNNNGAIISISLVGKELEGTISAEIGQLYELEVINLSDNNLKGNIPIEISGLPFLKSVNLSRNDLRGDASFLCSASFVVIIDVNEVDAQCTSAPLSVPSGDPSSIPSSLPTASSSAPTDTPSLFPSFLPFNRPSSTPSTIPTTVSHSPSQDPTSSPSLVPSKTKSLLPTDMPSTSPSNQPSSIPSSSSSSSKQPSSIPSLSPSKQPSSIPSLSPSKQPSSVPSLSPSKQPSSIPSLSPSKQPSSIPSLSPSKQPSSVPSLSPSKQPSSYPSSLPSKQPSLDPSSLSNNPSSSPSLAPSKSFLPTAGITWTQLGLDINGNTNNYLGLAIALSGDGTIACIGGYYNKLYELKNGNWDSVLSLPTHNLGQGPDSLSVTLDGKHFVASYPNGDGDGSFNSMTGEVSVYQESGEQWSQVGSNLSGKQADDRFGYSTDITGDGSVVIVGTRYNDYVKILSWSGSQWNLEKEYNGVSSTKFGYSVTISSDGTRFTVGNPFSDNNEEKAGSAHVFRRLPSFTALHLILGGSVNDKFGAFVDISSDGSRLAVGTGHEANYVQVFKYDDSDNKFKIIGTSITGTVWTAFGKSLSLSADGTRLAVGEKGSDSYRGKAHLYSIQEESWDKIGEIVGEGAGDYCGSSVALSENGTRAAIGAFRNEDGGFLAGHARIYESTR